MTLSLLVVAFSCSPQRGLSDGERDRMARWLAAAPAEGRENDALRAARLAVAARARGMDAPKIVAAYRAALVRAKERPSQSALVACTAWLEALANKDGRPVLERVGGVRELPALFLRVEPRPNLEIQRSALVCEASYSVFPIDWRYVGWEKAVARLTIEKDLSRLILARMSMYSISIPRLARPEITSKLRELWQKRYAAAGSVRDGFYVVHLGYSLLCCTKDKAFLAQIVKEDSALRKKKEFVSLGHLGTENLRYARQLATYYVTGKDPGR